VLTTRRRRSLAAAVVALLGVLIFAGTASASHFRYVNTSWKKSGQPTNGIQTVLFTHKQGWRRSAFGNPNAGDTRTSIETTLQFGDGGSDAGPWLIDFANAAEDYFTAELRTDDGSSNQIPHDYVVANGPFTARMSGGCCIISTVQNAHDQSYPTGETLVNFADDESPVSTIPAVVDNGGETLRWRLTNGTEACGGCSDPQPPGLSINANTGQVSWDTTGREGLWYSGAVIEALNSGGTPISSTMVVFIIRVADGASQNDAPVWEAPTPPDGSSFDVAPGDTLNISLKASDPNAGDTVQILKNSGPGTFTPTDGNPATGAFSFTADASQLGQSFIVQFIAQDNGNPPLGPPPRSFTINVKQGNGGGGPSNNDYMTGRSKLYNGRNQIQGLGPNRKDLDMLFAGSDEKRFKPKPFHLPCDDAATNVNFMMSWFTRRTPHSGKFVATGIDSADCVDMPGINPGGGASFDTWTGMLEGTYDGQAGHTAELTVIDAGEPGFRRDRGFIRIKASDGTTVFEAATTKNIASQSAGFGNHDAIDVP
jgi:hypothetical protein